MSARYFIALFSIISVVMLEKCDTGKDVQKNGENDTLQTETLRTITVKEGIERFAPVRLTTDISVISENDRKIIPILIEAAEIIDKIYWQQTFGSKDSLILLLTDENDRKFVVLNYGPWDRFADMTPVLQGFEKQPLGANFYPHDIKYLQYVDMKFEDKFSMYTILKRGEDDGLYTVPYHVEYKNSLEKAAGLLKKASEICSDKEFSNYLKLRAEALLNDNYMESDIAWLNMKDNTIDFLIGPYEDIEDRFLTTKTAYEAYLLVKDKEWSGKVAKYISLLPELQKSLPVEDIYKKEPVSGYEIYVYDAIYYAGFCNTGAKTISVNRPRDQRIIMANGMRNLQFKNISKLKFDKILTPIADILIDESQLSHIKCEAFQINYMFFEIAEGLGMKNTVTGKGTVKQALKSYYNILNTGKSDIGRLFIITKLHEMGHLKECTLEDNYVTAVADIFRSTRFGSHMQGTANIIRYNYFVEKGAILRNKTTGKYTVDFEKMKKCISELSEQILKIQGDGDYDAAKQLVEEKGQVGPQLRNDIERVNSAGIPIDLVFEQGCGVLGL